MVTIKAAASVLFRVLAIALWWSWSEAYLYNNGFAPLHELEPFSLYHLIIMMPVLLMSVSLARLSVLEIFPVVAAEDMAFYLFADRAPNMDSWTCSFMGCLDLGFIIVPYWVFWAFGTWILIRLIVWCCIRKYLKEGLFLTDWDKT